MRLLDLPRPLPVSETEIDFELPGVSTCSPMVGIFTEQSKVITGEKQAVVVAASMWWDVLVRACFQTGQARHGGRLQFGRRGAMQCSILEIRLVH